MPALKIRPEVRKFARAMERKLRENDYKGGWTNESNNYLLVSLENEVEELRGEMERYSYFPQIKPFIQNEAVDIANFAMMIFNNNE
jgi:hypothetical protein